MASENSSPKKAAGMEIGRALEESNAQKAEALCKIVENYEGEGKLPEGVAVEDVAREAIGMDWGYACENPEGMGAGEISGTLRNLKARLLSLLDSEAKKGEGSARMLGVFCGEGVKLNPSNVSFARGLLVSAFGAGQCSREVVGAAVNFICSGAVCEKDRKMMLEALAEAQTMGADLSCAKSGLEEFVNNGGGENKRSKTLARSILLRIDGSGDLRTLLRRSWTPRGHIGRGSRPAGAIRGVREPTGKVKL
jgi:hypothetical protein